VTSPLPIIGSIASRNGRSFSSVSTISTTIGRSCDSRRILAVCRWLSWPKPIGPRSTVAPASFSVRAFSTTAS
jgi:hypothetical protein